MESPEEAHLDRVRFLCLVRFHARISPRRKAIGQADSKKSYRQFCWPAKNNGNLITEGIDRYWKLFPSLIPSWNRFEIVCSIIVSEHIFYICDITVRNLLYLLWIAIFLPICIPVERNRYYSNPSINWEKVRLPRIRGDRIGAPQANTLQLQRQRRVGTQAARRFLSSRSKKSKVTRSDLCHAWRHRSAYSRVGCRRICLCASQLAVRSPLAACDVVLRPLRH